jgi:hypothetical protein
MPQYQVVDHFHIGLGGAEICLIERTLPGKAPSCVQFRGSWASAEIEADRLNADRSSRRKAWGAVEEAVNPTILARRQRALPTQFVDNSVGTFKCDRHVTR